MGHRTRFLSTAGSPDHSSHTLGDRNAFLTVHLEGSCKCRGSLQLRAVKYDDRTWECICFCKCLKMHRSLGGNPVCQSCQSCSLNTERSFPTQEMLVFYFLALNSHHTPLWVLLVIWQLGLLVFVSTSGNPVALTVLVLQIFFPHQSEPEVYLLSLCSP